MLNTVGIVLLLGVTVNTRPATLVKRSRGRFRSKRQTGIATAAGIARAQARFLNVTTNPPVSGLSDVFHLNANGVRVCG
jgi:hypothetical protein